MMKVEFPILDRINLELHDYTIACNYYPETLTYHVECITIGDSFTLLTHYNKHVITNILFDLYQIIQDAKLGGAHW